MSLDISCMSTCLYRKFYKILLQRKTEKKIVEGTEDKLSWINHPKCRSLCNIYILYTYYTYYIYILYIYIIFSPEIQIVVPKCLLFYGGVLFLNFLRCLLFLEMQGKKIGAFLNLYSLLLLNKSFWQARK